MEKLTADEQFEESDIRDIIEEIEKRVVRTAILSDRKRIDGRELDVVRPIAVRTGVLSRTHGSAIWHDRCNTTFRQTAMAYFTTFW
jgi:polyribonucleotide nucleotidyltransferase